MTSAPEAAGARPAPGGPALPRGGRLALLCLLALVALPELVLWLADRGIAGSVRWRTLAYQYGAFWPGLLRDWRPNFPLQRLVMFESYAIFHAGFAHMAGNLAGLVWLGGFAVRRFGPGRLVGIWLASVAAGGVVYGLLATAPVPMVGASGAVFGLAGAWIAAEWQDRRRLDRRGAALWGGAAIVGLGLANFAGWITEAGVLAWQTHLGGALAGLLLGALLSRRPRHPR